MTAAGRDRDLLLYIQASIDRIEQYTVGGHAAFLRESIVQDAVLRRLETLADAAGHLSTRLQARHPAIPWRNISGFRNIAAHGYLELDLDRVWQTIVVHLPPLKTVVTAELGGVAQAD